MTISMDPERFALLKSTVMSTTFFASGLLCMPRTERSAGTEYQVPFQEDRSTAATYVEDYPRAARKSARVPCLNST